MTHIIQYDNPNLFLLNGKTAIYLTLNGDFEKEDTIMLQDGRSESKWVLSDILEPLLLRKNTVLLNLTKEEV